MLHPEVVVPGLIPGYSVPFVSPERNRYFEVPVTGQGIPGNGTQDAIGPLPGTGVWLIRQQQVFASKDDSEKPGNVDPLPHVFRPSEQVLGVYSDKDRAQFFMDRCIETVAAKMTSEEGMEPDGASATAPEGLAPEIWSKLREASKNATKPRRVPTTDSEVGYKWCYRRWNIITTVWIQKRLVDAPPAANLW